jgi:Xaa-Pro aminopeptidase
LFGIAHLVETPPDQWIGKNLAAGMTLGYDPWLHTADNAEKLAKACAGAGATLVPLDSNPVDAIWSDRPAPPLGKVVPHAIRFAGEEAASKLARIRN